MRKFVSLGAAMTMGLVLGRDQPKKSTLAEVPSTTAPQPTKFLIPIDLRFEEPSPVEADLSSDVSYEPKQKQMQQSNVVCG